MTETPEIEVDVRCLALAHGGAMICEITAGEEGIVGKKAFVAGLIPGESARVRVLENRKSFVMGELVQITAKDVARIVPPCPVFGECGGCDLQYMPIDQQRELKRDMFEKTLQRQAGLTLREPVRLLGAQLPAFGYRKRVSLHLDLQGKLGFFREGSGDVVSFSRCLIASDAINALLPVLQELASEVCALVGGITLEEFAGMGVPVFMLRSGLEAGKLEQLQQLVSTSFALGKIFLNHEQVAEWHRGLNDLQAIEFSTLHHFSQINLAGNQLLIEKVLSALQEETQVTEFYAGSGNFSFPLARAGKRVDAIEVDRHLVERGVEQARLEKLAGLTFVRSSTEHYLQRGDVTLCESVLLDPPRSGARILCEDLIPERVRTIVYVSCALPTLARDLATLVSNGYELLEVNVLDMFAQTHHVESVSILKRPQV